MLKESSKMSSRIAGAHLNSGISASPGCLQILHSLGGGASSRAAAAAATCMLLSDSMAHTIFLSCFFSKPHKRKWLAVRAQDEHASQRIQKVGTVKARPACEANAERAHIHPAEKGGDGDKKQLYKN